ncbi:MAG: ABC transporter permease [Planctomycetes bacterium]|nr:ABC transporter permease [Planctomycetota bacterium]
MRLLLRQGLRHHRRHPLQTALTLLGIAFGVALLAATRLSQATAERAFDRAVRAVAGTATHFLTAGDDGLPVRVYTELRARFGGRGVAPTVQAIARVPDRAERTVLRVLGVDPFGDPELRPWAGPRAAELPVGRLTAEPGSFVATRSLLDRLGLAVGGELALTIGARPVGARCIGVLTAPAQVAAGLADTLIVDIATAQEWTRAPDRVDRLDLRLVADELPAGMTVDDAARIAREVGGPGARLELAAAEGRGLQQLTRGFRINVTALSLLSLLVGAFLVHETMRLSVVARRGGFGVLRALGTEGRALGLVVAAEAFVLGVAGSIVGIALGVVGAQLMLSPLVRTLNDHYATFAEPALEIDPWEIAFAALLGVVVTVVAALGPARAAARVSPREVLVTAASAGHASTGWRWWWSLPPALVGGTLLATVGDRLLQGYLGMLGILIAAVALTPDAMQLLLRGAGAMVAGLGPFARYVVRSTAAARGHLALPVAAMVLAVSTTIGMAVLVASFRDSVGGWLDQVLPGDVYVSVPGGVGEGGQVIEPAIVTALAQAPGVAACTTYRRGVLELESAGGSGEIEFVGMAATRRFRRAWPLLAGERGTLGLGVESDSAWVSEPLAFRWQLAVGDRLRVLTGTGPASLTITAIYRDYSKERGEVLVDETWMRSHSRAGITALGLEAAPGQDADALAERLRRVAADAAEQGVFVRSQRDLRVTSLAIFDRTFAITGVMRLLCLIVAFFGIYSAFAALQLERGREIGLLRCLGAAPSRIAVVVIGQTLLLGLVVAILALPLGIVVGHVLANVINRVSFGWTLVDVAVPWRAVVEAAVLAVAAAVLAGIAPARRFARMRPATALREA